MIRDTSLADCLLHSFPDVTQEDNQQIFDLLPSYIFYKTINKKKKDCICSHCGKKFTVTDKSKSQKAVLSDIAHDKHGKCPCCGTNITYRSYGMGRKKLEGCDKVAIMHAVGQDLFIRCFYVGFWYSKDKAKFCLTERHRYYAGENGTHHWEYGYRYSSASGWNKKWCSLTCENEPAFGGTYFNNYEANEYVVIHPKEWEKTCLKYCQWNAYHDIYGNNRPIKYLCMAAKHPNMEYLVKTGFGQFVKHMINGGTGLRINWRSNDLKKMLSLNKAEMQVNTLKNPDVYIAYKKVRKLMPGADIDTVLSITCKYGDYLEKAAGIKQYTGLSYKQIFNYCDAQGCGKYGNPITIDWFDYLSECRELGYNTADTAIGKPKDLAAAHQRTSKIIGDLKEIERQKAQKKWADNLLSKMEQRYKELKPLAYKSEDLGLQIVIPQEYMDIVNEGKVLHHCVGGYADRHANGALNILFIRKINELDTPYYTVEVSIKGKIVQCRGYRNNWADNPKPPEVEQFEKLFAAHLQKCFKTTKKSSKPKKQPIAAPAA